MKNRKLKYRVALDVRSNRPIHKRVLLHPITIFILLCVGILFVAWTLKACGDSYTVTAAVPLTPLNQKYSNTNTPNVSKSPETPSMCPVSYKVKLDDSLTYGGTNRCSSNANPINLGGQCSNNRWLLLAWPFYIVLILMTFSFWLGEKQEITYLTSRNRPIRNRKK